MDQGLTAPTRGVRIAPEAVWKEVRADYLAGMSGRDCARRHGVSLSALRVRAAREGWRRADQPWLPPVADRDPWDEGRILVERVGGDLHQIEPGDLARVAWGRLTRAVIRGDAGEVLRWHKVQTLMRTEAEELERFIEEEEARAFERGDQPWPYAPTHPDDRDGMDSVDSVDSMDSMDSVDSLHSLHAVDAPDPAPPSGSGESPH
ncbi:MAG: hypothetical protein ACOVQ6_03975 [Brevundimonas sp.]